MADFHQDIGLWSARLVGATGGALVSLIYLLPKSRREAAGRFLTGLVIGLIFGGPTGIWLARRLELSAALGPAETLLAGSAAASLSAWWALGLLARLADRFSQKAG